ncbi:hypothetical protein L5I01_20080 [Gordonia sp. HY442]|uniref:hypothetical protein n=1 Tax=Gordonia zhenghanii TaxID=2911516 RepID=UPI001F1C4D11|nr:hypothetical protein [Gordonia zhenghanii]MCF8605659.1 hypothetical protein [Gordonia zhenghanii]
MAGSAALMLAGGVVAGAGSAGAAPIIPMPNPLPRLSPHATQVDLVKSFNRRSRTITKSIPGRIGLAITPVGGDDTMNFGTVKTARAWSTLKVPVSIAAERANGKAVVGDIGSAIRASDNDAAERLWGSLGGDELAVNRVSEVLKEDHDGDTRVLSSISRPSSFPGYTDWTLARQSVFGAHLPCLPDSGRVLGYMRAVESNQKWGVKTMRKRGVTTAVKGGWGPVSDATGKYVVRQLGVVTTPRGAFAVSMAALPSSGTFSDGTAMLDRVGKWISGNLNKLPVGGC